MKTAIVLAAGKGTRMKSSRAKVLHPILGQTMIEHVMGHLDKVQVDHQIVVVGHQAEAVQACLKERASYAFQHEQLGTGHAIRQTLPLLSQEGYTLILYGDTPCVQAKTMAMMFEQAQTADLAVLTAVFDDPARYGRMVRNDKGQVEKIVEYKDCTEAQRKINEINTGMYCVKNSILHEYIPQIKNNNEAKEYYLTDLVELLIKDHKVVEAILLKDPNEVVGVNDQNDLVVASRWIQHKINQHWLSQGVTMIEPSLTYISLDTQLEADVVLYPNVYIEGKSHIKKGTQVLPNSFIIDSSIGENCKIDAARITDSIVGNEVKVGPYAHLRNHCVIHDKNRIGNFVEMKNTTLGYDSRCAHLTYLGDTTVGEHVNFGCGVVTVNYDGKNKYRTIIGDHAFIGSNVNLLAPIAVGDYAVVAAGSTISQSVQASDMAIARSREVIKPGYGKKYIEGK
jgi:bifunctional UDP-N-acetylglucosamine pyrophosphorylase / glucosamine-1-phosphate N-acetyltransferase